MKKIMTILLGLTLAYTLTSCGKDEKDISKEMEKIISDQLSAQGHFFNCPNGLNLTKTMTAAELKKDKLDEISENLFGTGRQDYNGVTVCQIDGQNVEIAVEVTVKDGKIVNYRYGPSPRQQIRNAGWCDLTCALFICKILVENIVFFLLIFLVRLIQNVSMISI